MTDDEMVRRISDVLVRLHATLPDMRFGQLVCCVTESARDGRDYGVYDVENVDFLAAAERLLNSRAAGQASSSERRTA